MNLSVPSSVVIADDDPVVRHLLTSVLGSTGREVISLTSGAECVTFLRTESSQRCSTMFLDVQLGDMSGLEILRTVKLSHPQIRVILVSANAEDELLKQFPEAASADLVLTKPFALDSVAALCK